MFVNTITARVVRLDAHVHAVRVVEHFTITRCVRVRLSVCHVQHVCDRQLAQTINLTRQLTEPSCTRARTHMHLLATDIYACKYFVIVLGTSGGGSLSSLADSVDQLMFRATPLSLTIGRLSRHAASNARCSHNVVIKYVDSGKVFQTMGGTTFKHSTLSICT